MVISAFYRKNSQLHSVATMVKSQSLSQGENKAEVIKEVRITKIVRYSLKIKNQS